MQNQTSLTFPLYTSATTTHYVPTTVQIDYPELTQPIYPLQMIGTGSNAPTQLSTSHNLVELNEINNERNTDDKLDNSANQIIHSKDLKVNDDDRNKILKHPLLPLVALLLEKCENSATNDKWPNSNSVNETISEFLKQTSGKLSSDDDDSELDEIMIGIVQVLRVHLYELEKVNELCQDFCVRYTSCLKNKLKSSRLLKSDDEDDDEESTPSVSSATNTIFQMVQTAQGLVAHPIGVQSSVLSNANEDHNSLLDDKDKKRGVLPKNATQIMKAWLFQHIVHPYPTEEEKRQIASQTNLTLLQVNNWFINARRRILQPMLDSSSDIKQQTPKKAKPLTQSRPQRFWPDKIASLQNPNEQSGADDDIVTPIANEEMGLTEFE